MIDGSSTMPLPLLGVLGEVGEHAVERGGHRVEPGDEEQEADVEDLLAGQPVAVDLAVEEAAEDVVAPLGLALVEHALEVVVDRGGRRPLVGDASSALFHGGAGDLVGSDDAVLHGQERRQLVERAGRAA